MRGKVHRLLNLFELVGITPAYAGKRNKRQSGKIRERDHPRVCGEKLYIFIP